MPAKKNRPIKKPAPQPLSPRQRKIKPYRGGKSKGLYGPAKRAMSQLEQLHKDEIFDVD